MTIPRLLAMRQYWEQAPPVHISLNRLCMAYLEQPKAKTPEKGNLQDLIDAFGGAGQVVKCQTKKPA
jgi:hypothetical protein